MIGFCIPFLYGYETLLSFRVADSDLADISTLNDDTLNQNQDPDPDCHIKKCRIRIPTWQSHMYIHDEFTLLYRVRIEQRIHKVREILSICI